MVLVSVSSEYLFTTFLFKTIKTEETSQSLIKGSIMFNVFLNTDFLLHNNARKEIKYIEIYYNIKKRIYLLPNQDIYHIEIIGAK